VPRYAVPAVWFWPAAVLLAEMGELEAFGRLERGPRAVGSAQMGQELQGNWPEMDVVQYDDAWMHSKTNQQHLPSLGPLSSLPKASSWPIAANLHRCGQNQTAGKAYRGTA